MTVYSASEPPFRESSDLPASCVRGRKAISGVETFPEQIAAAAVNRLQQMLYENEVGIPELPGCMMLPGKWVNGVTTKRCQVAKRNRSLV